MIVSMIDVDDLIRRRAFMMGRCALPWALGRRPVVLGGMTVCPHLMEAAGLASHPPIAHPSFRPPHHLPLQPTHPVSPQFVEKDVTERVRYR
jgi:hypothetical protein